MKIDSARKYYNLGLYETLAFLDTYNDWFFIFESFRLFQKNHITQGFRKGEMMIIGSGRGKSVICK